MGSAEHHQRSQGLACLRPNAAVCRGLAPAQVLFVGDSEFDAGCAQNAGCDFALATWGCFFPDQIPAQYKPQTPQELLEIVGIK